MKGKDAKKTTGDLTVLSLPLLESLSESRIAILFLARQAKEAKNNALAKELTVRGQSLRTEIARLRRSVLNDWSKETKRLIAQAGWPRPG
ncbi:MAG: hypothetical protein IPP35_12360 [Elusimicrobia bacterium]|nr:hypothetical protein [Elusimicrobiota bacterium]